MSAKFYIGIALTKQGKLAKNISSGERGTEAEVGAWAEKELNRNKNISSCLLLEATKKFVRPRTSAQQAKTDEQRPM